MGPTAARPSISSCQKLTEEKLKSLLPSNCYNALTPAKQVLQNYLKLVVLQGTVLFFLACAVAASDEDSGHPFQN